MDKYVCSALVLSVVLGILTLVQNYRLFFFQLHISNHTVIHPFSFLQSLPFSDQNNLFGIRSTTPSTAHLS